MLNQNGFEQKLPWPKMSLFRCLAVDYLRYEQSTAVTLADILVDTRTSDCQMSLHYTFL